MAFYALQRAQSDLHAITNPGKTIVLTEEYALLKREQYDDVAGELARFLDQLT